MLEIKGYKVADELFTKGYPAGASPCDCNSTCCRRGAYVDIKERERVLAHADMIRPYLDETQTSDETQWFETEIIDDPDYVSGKCVGTNSVNGKCAMQDKRGYCSLQVAATGEGRHKWDIKPLYCFLFPIEVIKNTLVFNPRDQGLLKCCSVYEQFEVPLFRACRDEVVWLLGEDGYAIMDEHYEKTVAPQLAKTPEGLVQLQMKTKSS